MGGGYLPPTFAGLCGANPHPRCTHPVPESEFLPRGAIVGVEGQLAGVLIRDELTPPTGHHVEGRCIQGTDVCMVFSSGFSLLERTDKKKKSLTAGASCVPRNQTAARGDTLESFHKDHSVPGRTSVRSSVVPAFHRIKDGRCVSTSSQRTKAKPKSQRHTGGAILLRQIKTKKR